MLDAERLKLREELTLRGDFSFDALSPDGRRMYLIRYVDPRDPTSYEVRVYDLARERLLKRRIVDPDEPSGAMFGFPQTRALSPDGRWAYTLYSRPGRKQSPFIHVLDTKTATAMCIDLDGLAQSNNAYRLDLEPSPDGGTLGVVDRGEPIAVVDLATFQVGGPPAPAPDAGSGWVAWAAIAGGLGLATASAATVLTRRRRRGRAVEQSFELIASAGDGEDRARENTREREPAGCRPAPTRMNAAAATVACRWPAAAARQSLLPMSADEASERLAAARRVPGAAGRRREGALIRDAQRGSADALEELFRRHWRRAHRAAYLVVGDPAAAEDIAQESFLAAIRALDRFDRRRPFGPWLHRIAVNRAIDFARARGLRGETAVPDSAEGVAPDPAAISPELIRALAELSPEHRAVVVLRHLLEYTPTEIGEMLGLPRGTVNSRLRRALDRLRPAIEEARE